MRDSKTQSGRIPPVRRVFLFVLVGALPVLSVTAGGCEPQIEDPPGKDAKADKTDAIVDTRRGPYHPDASCLVTIDEPPQAQAFHVDELDEAGVLTQLMFMSNPPAGGPHYPRWAHWMTMFMQYPTPIPRGYWIHNLEH